MPVVDERTERLLKFIVDHFDKEDRAVRDRQIRTWRRLKLLWDSLQHHYYSEVAHDWRIPDTERYGEDTDQSYYDKPINVYRAYLESIIAALSVTVPAITCYPDDADNPLDVSTAKAGDKIAELIYRHNDVPLLWLHALFIFCTEGMIACHHYPKESDEYGTYEEDIYKDEVETNTIQACPECGMEMAGAVDEFSPDMDMCPACGAQVYPDTKEVSEIISRLVRTEKKAKSRVCMDVYGGLYVKVPVWARTQKDCLYLIWSYETHYANALEQYSDLRDKGLKSGTNNTSGAYDQYEQWGRLSPQYQDAYPENNVTCRYTWLRPAAYNVLNEEDAKFIREKFPKGVKVVLVDDLFADAVSSEFDNEWTITYNPLSDYIHFDPIGLLLTSIQDITNDLVSLTLQTIEHGIPQTFANPKYLDFDAYRNSEAIPGGIYPASAPTGKPLSDGFYEVKTATLSSEVLPFGGKIQELGQLVSGALPSLFGGNMSGSRTASEYSMSRAQALQRLQNTWKTLTMWWKQIFTKSIPIFIAEMKEDERQVTKDKFGNFINQFVRRAEVEGKLGSVELEANENLPITWSQQKDTIMELIQTNNEMILQTLGTPENLPYLKRAIGLPDYNIPGEDDRQKQYEEIVQLINSEPIVIPLSPLEMMEMAATGQQPQPEEQPSVPVDIELDNHAIEGEICRSWLISDVGRQNKIDNQAGYQNVLLHYKAHKQAELQQAMQQMAAQLTSGANPEKTKKDSSAPIKGEKDVAAQTTQ